VGIERRRRSFTRRRASRVARRSVLTCRHPPPRRSKPSPSSVVLARLVPAFPQSRQGRPSHRVFRGRLGVHACYGLPTCRRPDAASCLPGFGRFVASATAGIATRPGRPLPGRDFHPLEQRTFSRHTWTTTPPPYPGTCRNRVVSRHKDSVDAYTGPVHTSINSMDVQSLRGRLAEECSPRTLGPYGKSIIMCVSLRRNKRSEKKQSFTLPFNQYGTVNFTNRELNAGICVLTTHVVGQHCSNLPQYESGESGDSIPFSSLPNLPRTAGAAGEVRTTCHRFHELGERRRPARPAGPLMTPQQREVRLTIRLGKVLTPVAEPRQQPPPAVT